MPAHHKFFWKLVQEEKKLMNRAFSLLEGGDGDYYFFLGGGEEGSDVGQNRFIFYEITSTDILT